MYRNLAWVCIRHKFPHKFATTSSVSPAAASWCQQRTDGCLANDSGGFIWKQEGAEHKTLWACREGCVPLIPNCLGVFVGGAFWLFLNRWHLRGGQQRWLLWGSAGSKSGRVSDAIGDVIIIIRMGAGAPEKYWFRLADFTLEAKDNGGYAARARC